ncbi:MAG TPA: 6-phosphogluconolactonase [Micropruina sp.]|nr:6-phosphogluconolactonase [Micropruina sp.]
MTDQVLRFADAEGLVERAAELLAAQLAEYQQDPDRIVHLCLTGGRIALRLYDVFGNRLEAAGADPSRMELWWTDERFTSTDDPARHAGPALALLAGKFAVDAARTHPMPAADGVADADAAAATYAKELADVPFDICLLSIGPEGHVAGIFPEHPSFEVRTEGVIGLSGSPKGDGDRVSLTLPALARSREVWFLANGADKAAAVADALAGSPATPAGVVRGREVTRWFIDRDAAADLPWYECSL